MTYLLWAAIVVLVLLPSKWDPAIQLKEANIRWAQRIAARKRK